MRTSNDTSQGDPIAMMTYTTVIPYLILLVFEVVMSPSSKKFKTVAAIFKNLRY